MQTGIEVKTEFFPLAFLLHFCTPVIEINGQKNKKPWGRHFFELAPGDYTVKVYFPYPFQPECGANQLQTAVNPGEIKRISFNMPPNMITKGKIKEIA